MNGKLAKKIRKGFRSTVERYADGQAGELARKLLALVLRWKFRAVVGWLVAMAMAIIAASAFLGRA